MAPHRLQSRISSDIAALNALNALYPWLPNEHTIRPSDAVLAQKRAAMETVERTWCSVYDYILHAVFGAPIVYVGYTKTAATVALASPWVFAPSMFPYNLPNNSHHWILWNRTTAYETDFPTSDINQLISDHLQAHLGHDRFQFGWYKNPRPTVPEFWHVQVFWTEG